MSYDTPDGWAVLGPALDELLSTPAADRPAVLARYGAAGSELRRELEALLAANEEARDFLETPAEAAAAPYLAELSDPSSWANPNGTVVGRYRVLREIARGGMGAVYLAERADGQFEQRVALKLVKYGMDTGEVLDRFLRERQILARLQHPHIAPLLDGGATDEGIPYYVMEYVAGVPITAYCAERRMPLADRLRLFLVVCRAVQYAHRNLVVHRDLKPSNVLVTEAGDVKLLDFGIATLVVEDASAVAPLATRRLMTPEYASPEQVQGRPVTTASDVYQLGLLLYEMVVGERPYRLEEATAAEIERLVCHADIPLPSTRAARQPAGSAAGLEARLLRGDLDAIATTALRKEPDRRYSSAEALADDVERHLAGLPIRARGDRVWYRARTLARRRRGAVATAAAFAVLITGFTVFYTIEMRRERDAARVEAAKAMRAAEFLERFFESWDPDAADRAQVSAEDLLRVSVARVEREMRAEPDVQAAMFSLLGSLYTNLGRLDEAQPLLERAVAAQQARLEPPHADLAATLARLGLLLYNRGEYDQAEAHYREAKAMFDFLSAPGGRDALQVRQGLATVLLHGQERFAEAETEFREVLRLYGDAPDDPSLILADAARGLGLTLFYQARYAEAEAILEPLLERNRRLFGNVHPVTVLTMQALSATVRDRGRVDEAEGLQREVVATSERLYGDDHANTLFAKFVLAFTLHRKGVFEEARRINGEVVEATTGRHGTVHPLTGRYVRFQAYVLLDLGELQAAEAMLRQALSIYRESFPYRHTDEAGILYRLAYAAQRTGAADAAQIYADALAYSRSLPSDEPVFVTHGPHFLADVMRRRGETGEAEALYRASLALYRAQLPAGHPYLGSVLLGLGELLLARGQPGQAEPLLRESLTAWQRWGRSPEGLTATRRALDRCLEQLGGTSPS